jgi:putative NIF3 family GTP cyclohydrolase 1 type 2
LLKEVFDVHCVKSSNLVQGKIKKVAVCGGSGSSLIGQAMASGAQVLVTGDVSYHNFFCEKDFMIMDIGHYESEIGVVDLIREILLKKIPNFAVYKSCKNNNPIQYHL